MLSLKCNELDLNDKFVWLTKRYLQRNWFLVLLNIYPKYQIV